MISNPPQLFDRPLHRRRRDRAASSFHNVNFLKKEAADRLVERLGEITRDFPFAIELGAHSGEFECDKIGCLIRTDMSETMLRNLYGSGRAERGATGNKLVCDEERLPFAPECADAVVGALSLHWVNDVPGTLIQIQRILKPDGLFLAVLPGARTLQELRAVLEGAEMELCGGVSPHVSPFIEVRDAGNLLMRANFALPMADSESITISYDNLFALLADLRAMGEGNALLKRARYLRRDVLMRAAELYKERYSNEEGCIIATVELVFLTGWKPHPSQPQPAKRGSGKLSLIEVFQNTSGN